MYLLFFYECNMRNTKSLCYPLLFSNIPPHTEDRGMNAKTFILLEVTSLHYLKDGKTKNVYSLLDVLRDSSTASS